MSLHWALPDVQMSKYRFLNIFPPLRFPASPRNIFPPFLSSHGGALTPAAPSSLTFLLLHRFMFTHPAAPVLELLNMLLSASPPQEPSLTPSPPHTHAVLLLPCMHRIPESGCLHSSSPNWLPPHQRVEGEWLLTGEGGKALFSLC